ncbi:hypothetical protein D3C79_817530 [compost metagenome]
MGECFDAVVHRCRWPVRLPVRPALPATGQHQPWFRPAAATADAGWRAGHGAGGEHALRRRPAHGHGAGVAVYREHLRCRAVRLVARLARGALVHHRLDGVPARRPGQHPDGAGLPAERVHHHVCQPAGVGAGGGLAVAGAGRPHQQPARAAGADLARHRAHAGTTEPATGQEQPAER